MVDWHMRISLGRLIKLSVVVGLVALALPAASSAQATRTWVSGVGDDANPCSRTAPCKTFAGAISKTAARGEINCLDPGGFGGVTITKSIAIKCHYTEGGVLVSGTNAIVVNAAATDNVTLRGLDINGIGTGLNGVRILQAKTVKILDSEIFGFVRNAVDMETSNANAKVSVYRTHIHDNSGNGVLVAPPASGAGAKATLKDNIIEDNRCGVTVSARTPDPAFNFTVNCGLSTNAGGAASANMTFNVLADHLTTGILARGNTATARAGNNEIVGNAGGVQSLDSGILESWGNNRFGGNTSNGAFNQTGAQGRR
jgi:hypothetical protein